MREGTLGAFCLHTSSGIGVPLVRMHAECRLFNVLEYGHKLEGVKYVYDEKRRN